MKLSVIIPVFNEERTIDKIIAKVLAQKSVSEVVVVDDGSTDRTVSAIRQIKSSKLKLIRHRKNQGKGAAVISGIKKARGDLLIIQDADLELDPSDYPKLLQPIIKHEAEFVFGNRWYRKSKYSVTRLGNWYLATVVNLLFGAGISDPYCCYKLATRHLWRKLKLKSRRFEIEAEIAAKVCRFGYKIKEVPIKYNPRTYRQGKKIRAVDAIKGTFKLLQLWLNFYPGEKGR